MVNPVHRSPEAEGSRRSCLPQDPSVLGTMLCWSCLYWLDEGWLLHFQGLWELIVKHGHYNFNYMNLHLNKC